MRFNSTPLHLKRKRGPPFPIFILDLVLILRDIWHTIAHPIARALRQNDYRRGRIWWCPTGLASQLPLHAAGPYIAEKRNFNNMYTQSYTPTLAALLRARQLKHVGPSARNPVRSLLLVGLPDAPRKGLVKLPKVVQEIEAIQEYAPHATTLMSSAATRNAVLDGLDQHSWIHFACHGHHSRSQPFRSRLSMWDHSTIRRTRDARNLP